MILLYHVLTLVKQIPIYDGWDTIFYPYVPELIYADVFFILKDSTQTVFIKKTATACPVAFIIQTGVYILCPRVLSSKALS